MKSQLIPREIRTNHRIAEMRTARKTFKCKECGWPIVALSDYYSVTIAGSGLGSIKRPDRVHVHCIENYFNLRANNYGGRY